MGEVAEEKHPVDGHIMHLRKDVRKPETMADYLTFEGTEPERVPSAYFVPPHLAEAVERLRAHGIQATPLAKPMTMAVEEFRIDSNTAAATPFQNHNERTLTGAWVPAERETARRHAAGGSHPAAGAPGVLSDRAALGRRAGGLEPAGRGARRTRRPTRSCGPGTELSFDVGPGSSDPSSSNSQRIQTVPTPIPHPASQLEIGSREWLGFGAWSLGFDRSL